MPFSPLNTISLNVLAELKLLKPTAIQSLAIPTLLSGRSALLASETGSGKTLCYALPTAERLLSYEKKTGSRSKPRHPRVLVLLPTRELIMQVGETFKFLSHHHKFATAALTNVTSASTIRTYMSKSLDVCVTSPQLIRKNPSLSLADVQTLIIDEADTMVSPESGFLPDVQAIAKAVPYSSQIVLAGATALRTRDSIDFLKRLRGEHNFAVLQSDHVHKLPATATVRVAHTKASSSHDKLPLLLETLVQALPKRIMVFTNSVSSCRAVAHYVEESVSLFPPSTQVLSMHGDMLPKQRLSVWKAFASPGPVVVVCTELAARGLDFDVDLVVLFDLPGSVEAFWHRAGRTARGGKRGEIVLLVGKGDQDQSEKLLKHA